MTIAHAREARYRIIYCSFPYDVMTQRTTRAWSCRENWISQRRQASARSTAYGGTYLRQPPSGDEPKVRGWRNGEEPGLRGSKYISGSEGVLVLKTELTTSTTQSCLPLPSVPCTQFPSTVLHLTQILESHLSICLVAIKALAPALAILRANPLDQAGALLDFGCSDCRRHTAQLFSTDY